LREKEQNIYVQNRSNKSFKSFANELTDVKRTPISLWHISISIHRKTFRRFKTFMIQ